MPRRFLRVAAVLLLVVTGAPLGAQAAVDQDGARAFIDTLGDRTVEILQDDALSSRERIEAFRQLFREGFAVPTIARFVLGRYWRSANEEQQQEYLSLFEDLVVETYARRFNEYSGETFEITGTRPQGEQDVQVQTRILRSDGPPVNVSWRVREREGGFQIVDVEVEGVSMALTQRNEFAAIIQRNGGNVEPLLQALRREIETARSRNSAG